MPGRTLTGGPVFRNARDEPAMSNLISHPLATGHGPRWASGWGEDQSGIFADLQIHGVTQRLRWIPAGEFLMGCPTTEPGYQKAYDFTLRKARVAQPFWLFDSPVTQALWKAVMGVDSPSRFRSETRPVETVDWHAAQKFCQTLTTLLPGLEVSLPSEREWEYACRAGTQTAVYTGEIEIKGQHNAQALDAIAWYRGNSGIDFELPNGWDATSWKDKQYQFSQAGTHPVKLKQPNPWGLYDMLGNVWEWCLDEWRGPNEWVEDAPAEGPNRAAVQRVIRGGAWHSEARGVRAACRYFSVPSRAHGNLGFRCRVQPCERGGGSLR